MIKCLCRIPNSRATSRAVPEQRTIRVRRLSALLALMLISACQTPTPVSAPSPPTPDVQGTVRAQVDATISAVRVLPTPTVTPRASSAVQTVVAVKPTLEVLATRMVVADATGTAIARAQPTPIPMPSLPVRRAASDASPAYTITKITDRETYAGRRRYLVETRLTNDSRDGVIAAMHDSVQWSFATLSDAKAITVWGFISIQPSWIGQAQVSSDGFNWAGDTPDDGRIDVNYAPLMGRGDKIRLDR